MLSDTERRRRSALRRLVLAGAVLTAAAVGTGTVLLWNSSSGPATPEGATPTSVASPAAAPPTGTAAVSGALPAPARVEQGIPVGYPHTLAGAVSAAAHYTEARDLLSPHLVGQQLRVMARWTAQDAGGLTGTWLADAHDWRTQLGLPQDQDGGSDANTFVALQARGYQLGSVSADQVDVWLLTAQTPTVGGVPHGTGDFVIAVPVAWANNDWKLIDKSLTKTPQVAVPDSPDASEKGWLPVAYQH